MALPIAIEIGRQDARYSICGERTCEDKCLVREFPGGVVYDSMTCYNQTMLLYF